jgi:hypothetical protein
VVAATAVIPRPLLIIVLSPRTPTRNLKQMPVWQGRTSSDQRDTVSAWDKPKIPLIHGPGIARPALHHRLLRVLRPASVILTRATSIVRAPTATRSAFIVASPAWTNSTICSAVRPRASMIASEQPSGLEASSSSARRRSGLGPRLGRSVGCLGYAGHNVDTAYLHRLIGALSPRALHQLRLACGGERATRTVVLGLGPSILRPIPNARPRASPLAR